MDEFKKVPTATTYEINAEAKIQNVSDKKPKSPSKDGRVLLKKDDGGWDYFVAEDLARDLFKDEASREQPIVQEEKVIDEDNKENKLKWAIGVTEALIGPIDQISTTTESKEVVSPRKKIKARTITPKIEKGKRIKAGSRLAAKDKVEKNGNDQDEFILTKEKKEVVEKECSESIKVWKLHQLGCSTDEILAHLKQPKKKGHSFTSIIWGYKQNKKRRDRADSK